MTRPGKPSGLIVRDETKADKQARVDKEAALTPRRTLSMNPPARIRENKTAAAAWRYLMRLYSEIEAEVISKLDLGLLEDYCITIDELDELRNMRTVAMRLWLEQAQEQQDLKENHHHDEAAFIAVNVVDAFEAIIKLDARMDRKKDLLHKLRQSLYLTPRARAGVAPAPRKESPPPDDLEVLIGEVTEYVNR